MSYNTVMGLTVKISKGREYLYFQAGKSSIYIGPKDDASRVKTENVVRALDHSLGRVQHYLESLDELLALLPEPCAGSTSQSRPQCCRTGLQDMPSWQESSKGSPDSLCV